MYLICMNHKENTLKHVYYEVPEVNEFHYFTSELIIFSSSSCKTIKLFEEI